MRAALLALLAAGLAPMLAAASPVRVVVGPGGPIDLPRGSEVVAIGPTGVVARAQVVSWEEEVRLDVPEGADRISAEAEGLWCSSTPVEERTSADAARRISCWRSGKVRGTAASATRGGEVTALAVRFVPAEATRDVEIANGLEASLNDPLVLGELAKLELRVRPPLDPEGATWIVEVIEMRPGAAPERVVESLLAADGSWSYARMVTGRRYVVRLKTSLGVGWWKDAEPFEMTATQRRRSLELGVEKVRGKVLLGRRPIAAVVTFGGEGRFPAIRMESDVSGQFEGKLPRLGAWSVSVRSSGPTVLRSTDVDVPPPGDDGVSDVEVRLPGGGLPGEIVNEAGDRVPNAVLAIVARGWREANTELIPDGTFLLEGLADGEYVVSAFLPRGGAESDGVLVRIEDGEVEEPVRLVLLPLRAIRGRTVAAPGIGLPRASVERLPDPGPVPLRGSLPPAGLDGSWVAEVARTRDFACLIHGSPGRATRMFRMEPRPEQQEVLLTSVGGELVVNATKMPDGGPFPALFHNGCMGYQRALGRQGLAAESEESGVVRVQGLFEPGEYSLCMITHEEHATYGGGRPAFPSCVHGTLLPGARLELTAPDR